MVAYTSSTSTIMVSKVKIGDFHLLNSEKASSIFKDCQERGTDFKIGKGWA